MIVDADLSAWVHLTHAPGIGSESQRKLLAAFGSPDKILAAGEAAVESIIGKRATQLFSFDPTLALKKTCEWLASENHHLITLDHPDYPASLLEIPDPPNLLFVKGNPALLQMPSIGIVGSRNATPQGVHTAQDFSQTLAQEGLAIISGLALGIDTAAHQGALCAHGATIAVIGTGADRIYPAKNQALARQIAECGAIVSEFPLGTPALAHHFPRRNRIISGLSSGILVVEAALESGSLITARMAAEQGREVFAIPGSIHSPVAKGCHQLIKQGAKLVESAQDILDELGTWQRPGISAQPAITATSLPEHPLLTLLGYSPCTLDELVIRSGKEADALLPDLLSLELSGSIAPLPGNRFQRLY